MITPKPTLGMRHLALRVKYLDLCEVFYVNLLGMAVEWRPDPDNVYLSSGHDNLALHRVPTQSSAPDTSQRLDHIGFIVESPQQVDVWYDFLRAHDVPMKAAPRTHRDGARSFYCLDPEGVTVQMIYHPPLSKNSA